MDRYRAFVLLFCGWVLWQHSDLFVQKLGRSRSWHIVRAYETFSNCQNHLERRMLAFLEMPKESRVERTLTRDIMKMKRVDKKGKTIELMMDYLRCFPAGTDPRPRFKE